METPQEHPCDKYTNDSDEILLFGKDLGLAEFFFKHMKKHIKTYDRFGNGFVWDSKSKLWEKREFQHIRGIMGDFIMKSVDTRLDSLEELKNIQQKYHRLHKKINSYVSLRNYVRTYRGINKIFNVCMANYSFLVEDIQTKMNNDPDCIPIADQKVINLKTLEIRERTSKDLFSFSTEINFDSGACENAYQYFLTLCNGDTELLRYLQLILGYCITGYTNEKSLFVFWGEASNGKSFLFNLLRDIFGECMSIISDNISLKTRRTRRTTPELMTLLGKRFVYYKQENLTPGRVNALTASEHVSARGLYQKRELSFKLTAKICILTNRKPKVDDRIKLIPFLNRFENTQENKEYVEKVRSEYLDEIASFVIRGAHDWLNGAKIIRPKKKEMNRPCSYILEVDTVKKFIQEKCEQGPDKFEPVSSFKNEYQEFCHGDPSLRPLSLGRNPLSKQMREIFGESKTKRINKKQKKCWIGVKIRALA